MSRTGAWPSSQHVKFDVQQNKWPGFLSDLYLDGKQAFYELTKTVRQFISSRRSLLLKDAEMTSLAWSAFTHLCCSQGSTYVDQATKGRIKLWLWNVGEIERAQQKKKEKNKERDSKERSNALAETPFPDIPVEIRWKI